MYVAQDKSEGSSSHIREEHDIFINTPVLQNGTAYKADKRVNNTFENGVYNSVSGNNIIYRGHEVKSFTEH